MLLSAKPFPALFLLLLCGALAPSLHAATPTWTLTWSDDFNGPANSLPDPSRWTYDLGGGGWGNAELETYTNSPSNVFQDGSGHLVIQALNNGGYTSARVKSQGLFNQAYGRVEASIQLPAGTTQGSGLWPAFWMLGNDISTVSWPACGEIDIMENIGQYNTANQNLGHIHGPVAPGGGDYYGGNGVGTAYTLPAGQALNTAYHLYAVEWSPSSITYYVDGVAYQTLTPASLPGGGQWVFNHPFFIILNLAVGGGVGGPVTCSFPQQLLVDYVRVYKLTSTGTSAYGGTLATVPGTIQAENFDTYNDTADPSEPGEGFAYNDLESANKSGAGRSGEGVDMETCSDAGGGLNVDWTCPGEWLQYSINVIQTGTYTLSARVASSGPGGTFHFDVDGTPVTAELSCPDTGGWQNWQDVSVGGISLASGPHQLLLVEDSLGSGGLGVCNFNYFSLSLPSSPTPTRTCTPNPSFTSTPSLSPTATLSTSQTATWTASSTLTGTLAPSASPTATPSLSSSLTPSLTPTNSGTVTQVPTAIATASATPIPMLSATRTTSPSRTASATATINGTFTPTATATVTLRSNSPTPSATAEPSATVTASPRASVQATQQPDSTLSSTPSTPGAQGQGPQRVLDLRPWPNPMHRGQTHIWVDLNATTQRLHWRVFSPAMVLIDRGVWEGPLPAGGQALLLDNRKWPAGLLYLQALLPSQDPLGSKVAKAYLLP